MRALETGVPIVTSAACSVVKRATGTLTGSSATPAFCPMLISTPARTRLIGRLYAGGKTITCRCKCLLQTVGWSLILASITRVVSSTMERLCVGAMTTMARRQCRTIIGNGCRWRQAGRTRAVWTKIGTSLAGVASMKRRPKFPIPIPFCVCQRAGCTRVPSILIFPSRAGAPMTQASAMFRFWRELVLGVLKKAKHAALT
mmetsp:Transcript_57207/g.92571  ORF Transcript_57207/g.92571 Transcript_57207/m.92571 type:complete len:201 (+) Transcript_57207:888-1490(+)